MHELPVTKSLLELVLDTAEKAGGVRVTAIHVVVGELSSILGESVQFYWDILAEGTAAEGAKLRFRHVAMQLCCEDCDRLFEPNGQGFDCPHCGSDRVRITAGDDLRLDAIDVELAGEAAHQAKGE